MSPKSQLLGCDAEGQEAWELLDSVSSRLEHTAASGLVMVQLSFSGNAKDHAGKQENDLVRISDIQMDCFRFSRYLSSDL